MYNAITNPYCQWHHVINFCTSRVLVLAIKTVLANMYCPPVLGRCTLLFVRYGALCKHAHYCYHLTEHINPYA